MKKSRMIITLLLSLILVMSMGVSAFAGTGLTEKQAVAKAIKDSGVKKANVTRLESEKEKTRYEIEFKSKKTKTKYEYEIGVSSGRILDKNVDYTYKRNTSKSKVSKATARKAAAKATGVKYTGIKDCKCVYEYDREDKEGTYDIKFRKGNYRYEVEVLAPTGKVIEYSKEYVK